MQELLKNLKPSLAQIIDLIYFQDIPQAEVADHLGISQMQVSRRLKKATAALQELMAANLQNGGSLIFGANRASKPSTKKISRSSLGAKLQQAQIDNNS